MTLLHASDLTDTMTRWPRSGAGYGSPVLHSPTDGTGVRWAERSRVKFSTEAERQSSIKGPPEIDILTASSLVMGDLVALGDHMSAAPGDVPTIHEVIAFRETRGFDQTVVRRATAEALIGSLYQAIDLFPVYRQPRGRSYELVRGDLLYAGPASVSLLSAQRQIYGGERALVYDSTLTIPPVAGLDVLSRFEADWDGPLGLVTFDVVGIVFEETRSPFLRTLAAVARRAQTDALPPEPDPEPDPEPGP